jgi:hypothetical protein
MSAVRYRPCFAAAQHSSLNDIMTFDLFLAHVLHLSLQISPARASSTRSTVFALISSRFQPSLHSLENMRSNPPYKSSGTMIRINTLSHVIGSCTAVCFPFSPVLPSSSKIAQYDNLTNTWCITIMTTSPRTMPLPESTCISQGEAARRPSISYRSSRHSTSACIIRGTRSIASAMMMTLKTRVESRVARLVVCRSRAHGSDDGPWVRCVASMLGKTSIVGVERGGCVRQ